MLLIHVEPSRYSSPKLSATLLFIAIATVSLIRRYSASRRNRRLPPGPRGFPIVGNAHQLTGMLFLKVNQWCKQYGPIVYLSAVGQPIILIGSHKAATTLLDQRAAIYSDRPRNIVVGELLTAGLLISIARYGDPWRRMRRASHEALNKGVAKTYFSSHEVEAAILVSTLLETPHRYREHIQRTNSSLMLSMIYGLAPTLDSKDPLTVWIDGVSENLVRAARPGEYLVELCPWMLHLPRWMCAWRREAEETYRVTSTKFKKLFDDASDRSANGTQLPCIVTALNEERKKGNLTDDEAVWTANTIYVGGRKRCVLPAGISEIFNQLFPQTFGQMAWCILALVLHPEVQKRAQNELDSVVGRLRMPSFQDLDHLPYITAVVKEIMRWRPSLAGVPHAVEEDDHYEGYFIPKGSMIISNAWGMNHDVDIYGPDAEDFRPERFLGPDGQLEDNLSVDTKEEGHVTYGFGRRLCIGRHVANNSLFIQIASIIWAFTVLPKNDAEGGVVLPDKDAFTERGVSIYPAPFECNFIPRFEDVPEIVAGTKDDRMAAR